jgi:hypothetical protein
VYDTPVGSAYVTANFYYNGVRVSVVSI